MSTRSVVIVDDHALLAEVMAAALRAKHYDVHVVGPSEHMVEEIECCRPDVVLLDLELGDDLPSGVDVAAELSETGVRTVMLTGVQDPALLGRSLQAGATGIVPKTVDFDSLMYQLQAALDDEPVLPSRNDRAQLWTAAEDSSRGDAAGQLRDLLTDREAVVLDGLVQGLSPQEIADQSYVAVSTVRSQIKSLRAKIGASSVLQAVAIAVDRGWEPGCALPFAG